ncbi:transcriptional regulator [Mycolicibacterium acapulense]|uniref:helix-turn-helix transcriptional regulator n=1 Tax=Mycobacterium TaxID=1763 RepID=UPI00074833B6|nr:MULTISPECIES: helix-turn-helix domain-containing protein [Mycobacterium]KUI01236.1 transcriptional regulator [Mycolicibacterium acapulense]KUI03255.1 transcriptional regulator [Mycolicibacterium acapulense]OBB72617.1 transcriptional regulator [Mycobacterium sp. 852014-52144_SCH5372336]
MVNSAPPFGPSPVPSATGPVPLSGQRLRVLEHVRAHAPVRTVDAAAELGLHQNTVREHLDALVDVGLVERATEPAAGRGRPAALYRPSAGDPALRVRDYASLATALAGHIARTSTEPERDARAAGVEWGREVAEEIGRTTNDPRQAVLDALDRLGFAPDDEGAERGVALRRCPLLDAARRYPSVVCQVHLGIVEGLLHSVDAPTGPGLDLIPFAEPGACRLFLPDPVVKNP